MVDKAPTIQVPKTKTWPTLSDFERHIALNDVISRMEVSGDWTFATTLYGLGKPVFTSSCSTAAVKFLKDYVELIFNPDFFDYLVSKDPRQLRTLQAVIAHEALHILLDHGKRRQWRDPLLWNLATDVVINEILERVNLFPALLHQLGAATWRSLNLTQTIAQETAEVVYLTMLAKIDHFKAAAKAGVGTIDDHSSQDGDSGSSAEEPQPGDGAGKDTGKQLGEVEEDDKKQDGERLRDQIQEAMEDAAAQSKSKVLQRTQSYGNTAVGEARLLDKIENKYKVSWDGMLAKRLATEYRQHHVENWMPSRKMRNWYPDLVLPSDQEEEEKKKYKVLVALDTSGSIDHETLAKMGAVLTTLPKDKVKLDGISFDTAAYKIADADKLLDGKVGNLMGGGGTSFECIERYAKKLPQYPDIVIVMTDGYASPIKMAEPTKWVWVIVPGGSDQAPKASGGETHQMEQTRSRRW